MINCLFPQYNYKSTLNQFPLEVEYIFQKKNTPDSRNSRQKIHNETLKTNSTAYYLYYKNVHPESTSV